MEQKQEYISRLKSFLIDPVHETVDVEQTVINDNNEPEIITLEMNT